LENHQWKSDGTARSGYDTDGKNPAPIMVMLKNFRIFCATLCFPALSRTIEPISIERSPAVPPVRCLFFIRCCPSPICLRAISAQAHPSPGTIMAMNSILDKFRKTASSKYPRLYDLWRFGKFFGLVGFHQSTGPKNLKNLSFSFAPVSNAGHAGENAECYTRGLQFVFATSVPPKSGPRTQ